MYDMTTFKPGQAGWTQTPRAAFYAGDQHADLSADFPYKAQRIVGTLNGETWGRWWKAKARVAVTVYDVEGKYVWGVASPVASSGDFALDIPALPKGATTRVSVVAFPASVMGAFWLGAGVVNLRSM